MEKDMLQKGMFKVKDVVWERQKGEMEIECTWLINCISDGCFEAHLRVTGTCTVLSAGLFWAHNLLHRQDLADTDWKGF